MTEILKMMILIPSVFIMLVNETESLDRYQLDLLFIYFVTRLSVY